MKDIRRILGSILSFERAKRVEKPVLSTSTTLKTEGFSTSPRKRGFARTISLLFALLFCLGPGMVWSEAVNEEATLLDALHRMRLKQQEEEHVVVRVQNFAPQQTPPQCTPAQQVRQRIKDMEAIEDNSNNTDVQEVNITAGHGELNVTSNEGTINSDINIQIVKQGGGQECL